MQSEKHSNLVLYEKATRAEIQNTRTEIADIEAKIKKIQQKSEASSYLTQRSLVDELDEEQLKSLIIEAGWGRGSMIYRLGKKVADKTWMKGMLNKVSHIYGSVKEFLQMALQTRVSKTDNVGINCITVFSESVVSIGSLTVRSFKE